MKRMNGLRRVPSGLSPTSVSSQPMLSHHGGRKVNDRFLCHFCINSYILTIILHFDRAGWLKARTICIGWPK